MIKPFIVRADMVLASTTYYRGTKDIPAGKLDHSKVMADGVWGPAMYLSGDLKIAKWYASKGCDYFGVVTLYQAPAGLKLLEWTDQDYVHPHPTDSTFKLLGPGKEKLGIQKNSVKTSDMMKLAKAQGYDGIDVQDKSRHGEPMLVLWKTEGLKPLKYLYYDIETDTFTPVSLSQSKKYDAKMLAAHEAWKKG